ncbi:hypothetical protein AAZX31_01G012100 [Glycine max]
MEVVARKQGKSFAKAYRVEKTTKNVENLGAKATNNWGGIDKDYNAYFFLYVKFVNYGIEKEFYTMSYLFIFYVPGDLIHCRAWIVWGCKNIYPIDFINRLIVFFSLKLSFHKLYQIAKCY